LTELDLAITNTKRRCFLGWATVYYHRYMQIPVSLPMTIVPQTGVNLHLQ
jgi:hypothetical protein